MAKQSKPGEGIDAAGGPVIDPTKNVLDLVRAEPAKRDEQRISDQALFGAKFQTIEANLAATREASRSQEMLQNWMRDAESKRFDQLSNLRQFYETRIAEMLKTSVESTSTLVSTQLVGIQTTFNDRVAKLEQFRYESSGRTSIQDPATADVLRDMALAIRGLSGNERQQQGRGIGRGEIVAIMFAAIALVASVAVPVLMAQH